MRAPTLAVAALAALAAAAALAGCSSASVATPTATSGSSSPGSGQGAAGSVLRTLVLTNTGSQACTLQGFPGVSYVAGAAGTQVGSSAVRVGPAGAVVRLAPGQAAHAVVSFANTGVFDPAACRPTSVRGLRVYPPGERAALFVAAPGTGCAGRTPAPQLLVTALAAP